MSTQAVFVPNVIIEVKYSTFAISSLLWTHVLQKSSSLTQIWQKNLHSTQNLQS